MVANYGRHLLVEDDDARLFSCVPRGRRLKPVCGDRVKWIRDGDGTVVTGLEPRSSELLRHDRRGGARVMAANIDLMAVVCAVHPPLELELLDRYCVGAEVLGIHPVIIFNKVDLLETGHPHPVLDVLQVEFAPIGYDIICASAQRRTGLDDLLARLADRTSVFVGASGVGKSSLVNALVPNREVRTAALSSANGAGRHATTATRLYHLPGRMGDVIDSPGVRDFRLWPISERDIAHGFREFRAPAIRCRFQDCRHLSEPGCAVRTAVADGRISQRRYESYRLLTHHVA